MDAQLNVQRITSTTVDDFPLQTYCRQECGIEIVVSKQTSGCDHTSQKEMRARISRQRTYFLFHREPAAGSHVHDTKPDQQALNSKVLVKAYNSRRYQLIGLKLGALISSIISLNKRSVAVVELPIILVSSLARLTRQTGCAAAVRVSCDVYSSILIRHQAGVTLFKDVMYRRQHCCNIGAGFGRTTLRCSQVHRCPTCDSKLYIFPW